MPPENEETEVEETEVETTEEETTEEEHQEEKGGTGFAAWLDKQDDATKGLIEDHTHGLTTALKTERDGRKELEKKLKKLGSKLGKDSEEKKQLDALTTELQTTNAKADFYEAAQGEGVVDLKLAWLAVQADEDLLDGEGNVDFEALKESHPQLFATATKTPAAKAHAGAGGKTKTQTMGMNQMIRRASGRR